MPVTVTDFREIALAIAGAVESSHMNHPDFRIGGKIFASLGYPDDDHGMVKLTPEQQQMFLRKAPEMFIPCKGVWGQRGATNVHLPFARKVLLRNALKWASQNVGNKKR